MEEGQPPTSYNSSPHEQFCLDPALLMSSEPASPTSFPADFALGFASEHGAYVPELNDNASEVQSEPAMNLDDSFAGFGETMVDPALRPWTWDSGTSSTINDLGREQGISPHFSSVPRETVPEGEHYLHTSNDPVQQQETSHHFSSTAPQPLLEGGIQSSPPDWLTSTFPHNEPQRTATEQPQNHPLNMTFTRNGHPIGRRFSTRRTADRIASESYVASAKRRSSSKAYAADIPARIASRSESSNTKSRASSRACGANGVIKARRKSVLRPCKGLSKPGRRGRPLKTEKQDWGPTSAPQQRRLMRPRKTFPLKWDAATGSLSPVMKVVPEPRSDRGNLGSENDGSGFEGRDQGQDRSGPVAAPYSLVRTPREEAMECRAAELLDELSGIMHDLGKVTARAEQASEGLKELKGDCTGLQRKLEALRQKANPNP